MPLCPSLTGRVDMRCCAYSKIDQIDQGWATLRMERATIFSCSFHGGHNSQHLQYKLKMHRAATHFALVDQLFLLFLNWKNEKYVYLFNLKCISMYLCQLYELIYTYIGHKTRLVPVIKLLTSN